jgi:hypothetical protein
MWREGTAKSASRFDVEHLRPTPSPVESKLAATLRYGVFAIFAVAASTDYSVKALARHIRSAENAGDRFGAAANGRLDSDNGSGSGRFGHDAFAFEKSADCSDKLLFSGQADLVDYALGE